MTPTPPPSSTLSQRRRTLVIWHGYLLGATGSNIYTHHLVDSWVRAGHDVVLACQEPDPAQHPRIHDVLRLAHDRVTGAVTAGPVRVLREPEPGHGRCTMVVPDIGGVLPVYVLDRYEGFEVVRVPGLDRARREAYAADQAAAMRWVAETFRPDGVLINHASPLPAAIGPVLERAGIPYAVKVHGSELEYALAEDPTLVEPATAALAAASGVLVGSGHIAARTEQLLGAEALGAERTHVVPPGVDLERFRPIEQTDAARAAAHGRLMVELRERAARQSAGRTGASSERVRELVAGDPVQLVPGLGALHGTYAEREIEATAPAAGAAIGEGLTDRRLLVFVGKLIPQKGVQLLLAALPDVLAAHPNVQLVMAGFGPLRDALEALLVAMATRNEAALDMLADELGSLSGEGGASSPHLRGWIDLLRERGELDAWLDRAAAARVDERVTWLGLVDHGVLAELWPLGEASVVPSVLAEAFGMVAAEAAACGCVPVVSDHSGLADAAAVIEQHGVEPVRFPIVEPLGTAVGHLRDALIARLDLDAEERSRQALQARSNVAAAWGWDQLAVQVERIMTG